MDPNQTQTENICLDNHPALSNFSAEAFSNVKKKAAKAIGRVEGVDSSKITQNLNLGVQKFF